MEINMMNILGNWKVNGYYTSEEVIQMILLEGNNLEVEISSWSTGGKQGICLISSKVFIAGTW